MVEFFFVYLEPDIYHEHIYRGPWFHEPQLLSNSLFSIVAFQRFSAGRRFTQKLTPSTQSRSKMVFGYSIDFSKIRARLIRTPWSKPPETNKPEPTQLKKKAAKPKHHWLNPSFGAGSTPTIRSKASSLDLNTARNRESIHDLQSLDPSWFSRRKSSLHRISATDMGFVEEVRLPDRNKQYEYVPLFLDARPGLYFSTSNVNSEGIEMEMDTDIERRGSMPTSPKKLIPPPAIPAPPIPPRNPARLARDPDRTLSFQSAVSNLSDARSPSLGRSISKRPKPRPAPLNFSRRGSLVVESVYFTGRLCASPDTMSMTGTISHGSRKSSLSACSLVNISSETEPILILRPAVRQSGHCMLSETPPEILLETKLARRYPESPRSLASGSTNGSRTTAARWWAVIQRTDVWDF